MKSEAVKMAARGFRVFPLKPGTKRPLRKGWQQSASSDPLEVFETWPSDNCNVGIATGREILIADADESGGKRGLESLDGFGLPETFTVATPRGGLHLYFAVPDGLEFSNSVERLAPGIDIRATGGLVAGPGSRANGGTYTVVRDVPLAPLPAHFADMLTAARKRTAEAGASIGPLDTPKAIERAASWLSGAAPAVEGEGGDNRTVIVANRVLDFGVSPETALELMLDRWNDKCLPPWDVEDLEKKVFSAASTRQDPIGRDLVGLGFVDIDPPAGAVEVGASGTFASGTFASRIFDHCETIEAESAIPPRPWLIENFLIREAVTMLTAPGSAGKSTLALQVALALATGDGTRFGFDVREAAKVLVINNEDPPDEMRRRVAAIHRHYGLDRAATFGKVRYFSNRDGKFQIATRDKNGRIHPTPDLAELKAYVRGEGVGCIALDPLVSIHQSEENNNTEMQRVMDLLTSFSISCSVSTLLISHTSKPGVATADGYAGNANAARGASSVKDACRLLLTLFGMSEKDGEKFGIDPRTRHRYVRLDDAKMNMSLASPEARWFSKATVYLDNAGAAPGARPDALGVLVPAMLKDASGAKLAAVAEIVARGIDGFMSVNSAATLVRADPFFSGLSERAAAKLVVEAFAAGRVEVLGRTIRFERVGETGGKLSHEIRA